ncbi:ABC transporter ATP-binding protein [Eubacterium callanderi]|uniref:ABC transporter ATP-binding protein n=1 Tax=Eubacterium callanderi TaxID=53442 RepID=UPI001C11C0D4|nr:ABC transporter ATP-binding protein [Eubacterium callanderi]MBU5304765.1 ABC transporter ATP-binding protein/permease [Eubacterium callanderi]WPK69069.1 putative ABC transporter ATP-binding protein [Eubacterium callanderi]WPK73367.1 putative ABC transporter ATP-binding protein [Eubacterium callanderi]
MVKTLLGQVKQYKKASLLTPLFTALEVVMEVLIPLVISLIIDRGIEAGNIQQIYFYGGIMVIMAMASLIFGILAGKYAASASSGLACNLREEMYGNIQRFSFSNIDKYSTAGLVTRLTTDVTNVQNAYQMILRMCTRAPLMLISAMVMCFFINTQLSLVFVAAIVVLGLSLALIILKTIKIFDQVFKKYDALNESVQENVSAIRVVKAYVREDYENTRFTKAATNLYQLFVKAEGILAFNNPVMMFVIYGCILGISWLGAQMIIVGSLTTGELTAMFSYIMNIMMSLMMLSMIFVMVTMSLASCRRITEVLEEQADIKDSARPVTAVENGSIDFEQVCFAYKKGSGKETLSDIDLHIRAGETIGIIGGTGSGKSSLVNLISRLYDVTDGRVLVGGRNVRDYDLEALRNQVSVVLQKNVLFSGTILDNLRWGNEQATLEECKHACRLACADTFIEQLPDKYDTVIDQGGTNVSGGQKQRICIARALLKKPKILILDDSTSAVDTATDARIRRAFISEIPGTTKLIIAQRISSVEDADRVLVMDAGRVNAFDTPDNLLKTNAIYQEIYASQLNGGGDFDEGSMEMEAVS